VILRGKNKHNRQMGIHCQNKSPQNDCITLFFFVQFKKRDKVRYLIRFNHCECV